MYAFIRKRRLKTRRTVVRGIPSSRMARLFDFLGLRLETLSDYLHIILRHVQSSCALAFTQTFCFLELPIPPTDALSTRGINSVTSTKLTLQCDYLFTPRKLQHTKRLLLYGRHFLTDCRGATATVEPSCGNVLKLGVSLFHLVDDKLIHGWLVRNYAYLNWDLPFWITLYINLRFLRTKRHFTPLSLWCFKGILPSNLEPEAAAYLNYTDGPPQINCSKPKRDKLYKNDFKSHFWSTLPFTVNPKKTDAIWLKTTTTENTPGQKVACW